jgi:slime mold repeat-containing protein
MLRRFSCAAVLAAAVGSVASCEGDYVFLEPDSGGIAGFSGLGLTEGSSSGDVSQNGGRASSLFDAGPDASAIPCYVDQNCNDRDACNGVEQCVRGYCQAGTPVICEDQRACITDRCDPATGACVFGIAPDGTTCPDTDLCDGTETCFNGTCSAAGSALGCDDANACTVDTCNPMTGCVHAPALDGTPCPDADPCDGIELCLAGACAVSGSPLLCGDGNVCTTDSCVAGTGCSFTPVANGTSCADGDVCDGAETCNAGVCSSAGTPLRCNDGNPCTTDTCVATVGCLYPPVVDGTACPDGNRCDGTETCVAGACTGVGTPPVCGDDNPCTADVCVATVGCLYPPVPNGMPCPNANACDGVEICNGAGQCTAGSALVCSDDNACTRDTCNAITGCVYTALTDGTDCPDANLCDGTETCTGGVCSVTGVPLLCPAGHSCLPSSGLCN